jgi:hypothetical protein
MIGSTPALPTGRSGPGVEGGPVTLNFNSQMALANNKVGVGIIAVQDQSDKCFLRNPSSPIPRQSRYI